MGLIFSRFYEKPSTRDKLERIEQELQNIEERRWDKIKREQFVVQILSFIPITILIATVCILIYPSDSSIRDKLLLCIPIIILNLVLWICRRVVQWYSRYSLDNEEARLRKLQKEKKRILEMVCETESYRVAAELLEKYDPKQLRRKERGQSSRPTSPHNTTLTKFSASPNRRASIATNSQSNKQNQNQSQMQPNLVSFLNQSVSYPAQLPLITPTVPPPTPSTKSGPKPNNVLNTTVQSIQNTSILSPTNVAASSVQGRPVRPVLSKDRSMFEKIVDWVIADGPDNRFALICRYCYGHNGMSLAEEYETINFRCCYCYNLNTATNKRHQVHDQLQPEREKSDKDLDQTVKSDTNDLQTGETEKDVPDEDKLEKLTQNSSGEEERKNEKNVAEAHKNESES